MQTDDNGKTVQLSGRLEGEFVGETNRACSSSAVPVVIDAGELQDADVDGLGLLAALIDGGVRVEGLSRYLTMRLEALRDRGDS